MIATMPFQFQTNRVAYSLASVRYERRMNTTEEAPAAIPIMPSYAILSNNHAIVYHTKDLLFWQKTF